MTARDRFATPNASPARKRFADLIEYFLHPSLCSNPDVLYRVRTLIALLLVYAVMLAFGTCATIYQLVTNGSLWPQLNGLLLCLVSIAFNSYLLMRLRRKGSYFSSSAAAILIATATVIAGMAISGGVRHSWSFRR